MTLEAALIALAAFVIAAALTGLIRRFALARGMLDVPNERSLHSAPTPRGGGAAIVVATFVSAGALAAFGQIDRPLLIALLGGGAVIALIGFIDDRRPLPAWLRLAVHLLSAAWAVHWLGGIPPIRVGAQVYELGLVGDLVATVGIVWALNLFNFMDGIDGIAASEAAFIAFCAFLAMTLSATGVGARGLTLALGAASVGFLLWNWPKAGIFMGDVGSGFLGYAIAVLALAHGRDAATALLVWASLGAVFIADSGVTLLRRWLRGERVSQAHRTHAYQRLAQRWRRHAPVTLVVLAFNVLWLAPCALFAALRPQLAGYCALAALVPTALAALLLGAGRRD